MNEILILSGAGLSAESGLKTFRDSGGLWEEYDVVEVCPVEGFIKDRQKVIEFYNKRRADLQNVHPNLAHQTIAKLKSTYKDQISILTQNVDDLLERAGCEDVIHLRGTLTTLRCESCGEEFQICYESQNGKICPKCSSDKLRHNIIMFGEQAPFYEILYQKVSDAKLFICIGTSGEVLNIAGFASNIEFSTLNNLECSFVDRYFCKVYIEQATSAISKIAKDIEHFTKFGDILL